MHPRVLIALSIALGCGYALGGCTTVSNRIIGANEIASDFKHSAEECCAYCDSTYGCKAWTFDSSLSICFLKNNVQDMGAQTNRISGYPDKPTPNPPKPPTPVPIPRACSTPETSSFPFCDTSLSIDARIKDLISRLHDDEKPPLLTARESPGGDVPRIGLPEFDWGANCVHGVGSRCGYKNNGTEYNCPTSFSMPNALGASFNMSLVHDMAAVIGVELRSLWLQGVGENHGNNLPHLGLDCWSPNINVNRDPRWGRNQEVASEDPFVLGEYAKAYTKGLQEGQDKRYLQAVVTLKHWDAYSLEHYGQYTRHNFNAVVSPQMLASTYMPAFKAAVTEANAKGIMCSYNALNGVPTCASSFLRDILRKEWDFEGYMTSDSGAVFDIYANHHYVATGQEAAAAAVHNGTCDIDSGSVYNSYLLQAVNESLVSMADVDNALYNTLRMRFELGLFDPIGDQPYWHIPPEAVNTPESQALNLFATQQSMVLLKNDKNTLPMARGKKIAVIGPHTNATRALVGNYIGQICPDGSFDCVVSPCAAIAAANHGGETVCVEGCAVTDPSTSGFAAAISAAKDADQVVMVMGIDQSVEGEGDDRTAIDLPGAQHKLTAAITSLGKPTTLVLINGGMVAIAEEKESMGAIIEAFYPGYQGSAALATVLFGDYNPGGKLPITIYNASYVNEVDMFNMDMAKAPGRSYRYFTGTPVYPFGWGLSYTTFTISGPSTTTPPTMPTGTGTAEVSFTVTNTGKVAGDEVVMLFNKPQADTAAKSGGSDVPLIKSLIAFQRVHVGAGESVTVSLGVSAAKLGSVDVDGTIWSDPGVYELEVTNGVQERLNVHVKVAGDRVMLDDSIARMWRKHE